MCSHASRSWVRIAAATLVVLPAGGLFAPAAPANYRVATVSGTVASGTTQLASYSVTLYRTSRSASFRLGHAITDADGRFSIGYTLPRDRDSVLDLVARKGPVALAIVLGSFAMPAFSQPAGPHRDR